MSSNVEFSDLADFQLILHSPPTTPGETICSSFYQEHNRKLPHSLDIVKNIRSSGGGNLDFTYTMDKTKSYLCCSWLHSSTGEFKVKEEYKDRIQIRLTRNYGYNMTIKGKYMINGEMLSEIDPGVCEAFYGYNRESGDGYWENHERNIGNYRCLLEWGAHLVDKPIAFVQPFSYCYSANKHQLLNYNSLVNITHHYTFVDPKKLIMMRIKHEGEWYDADSGFIEKHFDHYIICSKEREIPELVSTYSKATEGEIESFRCKMKAKLLEDKYYGIEYKDMVILPSSDSNNGNLSRNFTNENPILGITFAAKNVQAENFNNYSNYSNDTFGIFSSEIPIAHNSLEIGSKLKFSQLAPIHLVTSQQQFFKSLPRQPGILAYALASNPFSDDYEYGPVVNNNKSGTISSFIKNDYIPDKKRNVVKCTAYGEPQYIKSFSEPPSYKYEVRLIVSKNLRIGQQDPQNFDSVQNIAATWNGFA